MCDPSAFNGLVIVDPGILGPKHGSVGVDLIAAGYERTWEQDIANLFWWRDSAPNFFAQSEAIGGPQYRTITTLAGVVEARRWPPRKDDRSTWRREIFFQAAQLLARRAKSRLRARQTIPLHLSAQRGGDFALRGGAGSKRWIVAGLARRSRMPQRRLRLATERRWEETLWPAQARANPPPGSTGCR